MYGTHHIEWKISVMWSHRYQKSGYGINPIGVLRSPMGLIPKVSSEHLWDQSHRCPQITYGIDPIGLLKSPLGLIPYIARETHQE